MSQRAGIPVENSGHGARPNHNNSNETVIKRKGRDRSQSAFTDSVCSVEDDEPLVATSASGSQDDGKIDFQSMIPHAEVRTDDWQSQLARDLRSAFKEHGLFQKHEAEHADRLAAEGLALEDFEALRKHARIGREPTRLLAAFLRRKNAGWRDALHELGAVERANRGKA